MASRHPRSCGGNPIHEKFATIREAYALSARQSDVLRALVQTGAIRDAACTLDISYDAARNTVAELKLKLGVATVPMMIGLILDLASEEFAGRVGRATRHDLFSLSERQYAIARNISIAKSRAELAAALRVSEAVVDAELKEIHLILGVRNAGELALVVAAASFEPANDAAGSAPAFDHAHDLPVAMVERDGRQIGYSDFGPAEGWPVLILHSTITSRAPPMRLVAELQRHGYRPVAIDRPGFGDSDMAPSSDPFASAADDAAAVCAALGWAQVDLIARGSGQAAIRLAQTHPALVRRAILVNPTPAVGFTTVDRGPLGAVKRAFARRPWAIAAMIRALAIYATPRRMYEGMLRSFRESPPDLALVRDDPQFVADYLRAGRAFGQGRIAGYVAEQAAWGAGYDVAPMPGMGERRIVQGRHFVLHDPDQAMAYWRGILPDTPIDWIDDAGQMLAYSHPHAVVAALG
jgi:pimeloyl-ACP methyl ester carboxylesterase/DNA-binding CsgD family transcriptional regulator